MIKEGTLRAEFNQDKGNSPSDPRQSKNGAEFTATAGSAWLGRVGAKTLDMELGSPWSSGHNESSTTRQRDPLLNGKVLYSLKARSSTR
jgi:hypothetical protein